MKIAISGKGGVGKTTLAASLINLFAKEEFNVIGIDSDSFPNLAETMGFNTSMITPISEMKDLIQERTGIDDSGFYRLNPDVSDILDTYSLKGSNFKLLVLGTIKKANSGCFCPENTFLKAILSHVLYKEQDIVIVDMEAGLEHFGRGTAKSVDFMIVVVIPDYRSIKIAHKIRELWEELSTKSLLVVGNMIDEEEDKRFIENNLKDFEIIGFLPYNKKLKQKLGGSGNLFSEEGEIEDILQIKNRLIDIYESQKKVEEALSS